MTTEKKYLDYETIKRTVSVLDLLTKHYNWGRFLETVVEARTYTGSCPICETERGNPFRISIEENGKNSWFCLAKCNAGGNVLDFVAMKEDTDIHEAAFLLHEWFDLKSPATNGEKKTAKDGKGYLRDLDKELKNLLAEGEDEATIRFVKEKVLESYRNGIEAGKTSKKTTKKKPAKVAS